MTVSFDLIPKVERDDPLGHAISTSIDKDLIGIDLFRHTGRRRGNVSLDDLDVAVVPLSGFGDVDGCGMHQWYATLWLLNTIYMLVGMFYTSTSKYSPGHAQDDWGTSTSSTKAAW